MMASIYVEDKAYEVNPKQNLLHACLSLGFDLPYFCWHPALGSVGACRQCAVKQFKDADDKNGKLIMACMTPASNGTRISIQDHEAAEFRAAVIQGLMQNHPHDCPVCDEGGECHLQDMTVMTGHRGRTYHFSKRTFRNQYLGPLINHEMNRCIQCQRCVRYYREYAGGHDLNAFRLRDSVYFGRANDGVLENEFAGNLVEICPTGVFTDATLKHHYTRKWDLTLAPSVCPHCAVGCNTSVGERYGSLRRVVNRYHPEINGYFLCDRGRFGYEFVNSEDRLKQPLAGGAVTTREAAVASAGEIVASGNVIGIGSPRASLEGNYALWKLVGPEHFYSGLPEAENRCVHEIQRSLQDGPVASASLREIEHADAAFVLGEDVTNVAPVMALALRQSVRQASYRMAQKVNVPLWLDHAVRELAQEELSPLFVASPYPTKLDEIAAAAYSGAPDDLARLAFAVAHEIDAGAPAVPDLDGDIRTLASRIAKALVEAERPLVISGASLRQPNVIQAAAQVAWALHKRGKTEVRLAFTMAEANTFGLGLLEAPPLEDALAAVRSGNVRTVVVLENDLHRRLPSARVNELLRSVEHVIVLDSIATPTTRSATFVLPTGTYAEIDGTFVNSEGRAQRFFRALDPEHSSQESWRWIRDLASASAGRISGCGWSTLDEVLASMAIEISALGRVPEAAPARKATGKIAREPNRYSGRTSMLANITIHEPKPPEDPDSPLAFSMESDPRPTPSSMIPFFWAPGWNSIQATNKFQTEIGGHLRGGDPGIRLIEPHAQAAPAWFSEIPPAFRADSRQLFLCPAFHIFGSEELSIHSPGIAELAPKPYVAVNPLDADLLGMRTDEPVRLRVADQAFTVMVRLDAALPRGVACLPVGLTGLEGTLLPAPATLFEVESAVSSRSAR
jgi:NADH-quinone oxidoreductase subunit G